MIQNNKSATAWWQIYKYDIVVAQVSISGFVQ